MKRRRTDESAPSAKTKRDELDTLEADLRSALVDAKNLVAQLLAELSLPTDVNEFKRSTYATPRVLRDVLRNGQDESDMKCVSRLISAFPNVL